MRYGLNEKWPHKIVHIQQFQTMNLSFHAFRRLVRTPQDWISFQFLHFFPPHFPFGLGSLKRQLEVMLKRSSRLTLLSSLYVHVHSTQSSICGAVQLGRALSFYLPLFSCGHFVVVREVVRGLYRHFRGKQQWVVSIDHNSGVPQLGYQPCSSDFLVEFDPWLRT